jgi:hypothetical protein
LNPGSVAELRCVLGTPVRSAYPFAEWAPARTLRDAALYITKLPKAEHDADEWQAAMG